MSDRAASDPANDAIFLYPRAAPRPLLPDGVVTPVGVLLSTLVVVALTGAFAAIVSLGPAGRGAALPASAIGPTLSDAVETAVPATGFAVPMILLPDMDYAQIAASLSTDPATLCTDLDTSGFRTTPWQHSLVDPQAFECASVMVETAPDESGDAVPASTVFYMFRGSDASRITTLRLKLNLLDPGRDDDVVDRTRRFLTNLKDYPDLAVPQSVIDGVSALRATTASAETATIRFAPEVGDRRRFNLTVDYRPPAARNRKLTAPSADSNRWAKGGGATDPQPQETTAQTRMAQPPLIGRNGKSTQPAIAPQLPTDYSR